MTVPPGAIHTFKNASDTEDCACYMTATPGRHNSHPISSGAVTDMLFFYCFRSLCGL